MVKFNNEDAAENLRVIETDGSKIFLNRTDPFGFWSISFEKGTIPATLSGSYTSSELAAADVDAYLTQHKTREKKVS